MPINNDSDVLTLARPTAATVASRVSRPKMTADTAIAKLRAFAASRDLIVAPKRTNALEWYASHEATSFSCDLAPSTLRSGAY